MLHSGCINNFSALCAMSGRIMSRLAHFMYCVSCSPELVPSLVLEHDGMKVIAAVLELGGQEDEGGAVEGRQGGGAGSRVGEDRKESLDGAKETCAALLFNMSTQVPRSHRRSLICRPIPPALCVFPWRSFPRPIRGCPGRQTG